MGSIDIRQFYTTIEQFVGLKELYPMGNYGISSSDQTCRTTWFEITVPINNVNLEITWFLDADNLSESVWKEMAEELELI